MTQMISALTHSFEGELLGRSGNYLYGWARNLAYPDEAVSLDIMGDGQWLGSVRAEFSLAFDDFPKDGICHGFMFAIKPDQWQSVARLEVWITNNKFRLKGVIFTHQEKQASLPIQNTQVYLSGGMKLVGWACNPLDSKVDQKIIAYEAGQVVTEGLANQYSEDLEKAGFLNTKQGFSITLPLTMADGKMHNIAVLTSDGKALNGSPVSVILPTTSLKNWTDSLLLPLQDQLLLRAVMERYEWQALWSTDFSYYPQWSNRFAHQTELTKLTTPVLVCITGSTDLDKTIASLIAQSYKHWYALICSENVLSDDNRIQFIKPLKWLKHLQSSINKALDIVSFIIAGDTLAADAFATLTEAFNNPSVQIAYTDCDQFCDNTGSIIPWFKPNWDPDLFLASTPLHYLFATRPAHLAINNPYLAQLEAWPWLAVQSVGDDSEAIYHIPQVLYHRNKCAMAPMQLEAQRLCDSVLAPELNRVQSENGKQALVWPDPIIWPSVSLIIPTRDHVELLKCCIESLLNTDYPIFEIIIIDNDSADIDALTYLAQLDQKNIQVIKYPGAFNFSKINNYAVELAKGSIIGLINNDIEAIQPNWLKVMVRQLVRPNIGAVGAKLLWPNGMVQHAGVVLGLHGLAGHTGNNWYKDDFGYFGYNQTPHSVSAVTAACLLCKRDDYISVGGLDENDFPVNFNDVDLCLKLRKKGKRIIWTPDAQLVHAESASRGTDKTADRRGRTVREQNRLLQKWYEWIIDDPYYNPNLNLDSYSYAGLAIPPRQRTNLKRKIV